MADGDKMYYLRARSFAESYLTYPPHGPKIIHYADPMSLAHELGHAIGLKAHGQTSEFDAWRIAREMLKPKYWRQEYFAFTVSTYPLVEFVRMRGVGEP